MLNWIFGALLAAGCTGHLSQAQASDTWKMILSKSQLGRGNPAKAVTARYEAGSKTEAWTFYQVQAKGVLETISQTLHFDGKEYPCGDLGWDDRPDTVVSTRLDAWTAEVTYKRSGRVTRRLVRRLSADGKQMTLEVRITPELGPAIEQRLVFEK